MNLTTEFVKIRSISECITTFRMTTALEQASFPPGPLIQQTAMQLRKPSLCGLTILRYAHAFFD